METITNEEAAKERDRIRKESSEKAERELKTDSQNQADEIKKQNEFKKGQKESAKEVLESGSANKQLSEIFKAGGSLGRRLERELRQFERTGRVSNWLAGETLKAESAQNAAQQAAFRQQVTDVISTQYSPLELASPSEFFALGEKPQLSPQVSAGGEETSHPFQISTSTDEEGNITLTVNVGTLNSLLPSNIFDGPKLRKFSVGSGLRYVVLTGTSDGRQFTTCSLSVSNQSVRPQEPTVFGLPTTVAFLLGVVYNGKVFQAQNTNLLVTGKQQYVKQKAAPAAAGTLPYEIYYVWG